jgi:hypothetical protein
MDSKLYSKIISSILALDLLAGIPAVLTDVQGLHSEEGNTTDTEMHEETTATTEQHAEAGEEQHNATEAAEAADHESNEEKEHSKASSVRDSVALLLQDNIIPAEDFIHLYDSTPYHIMNGHVAIKVPCEDDSTTPIQVLIGSAPNMTVAELENIAPLSTPGELCLYHVDLVPSGNVTVLTDVALNNTLDEDIEFPPTSTVAIGINEVKKGEHEHAESMEEHGGNSTATITAEEVEHPE